MLVPQNMPLQPLCCCGTGPSTICQGSTLLAKHKGGYLGDLSVPATALLFFYMPFKLFMLSNRASLYK